MRMRGWSVTLYRSFTKLLSGAGAPIMLAPMLCVGGCSIIRPDGPAPSVHQGPMGNAILATLPAGTMIRLDDPARQAQMRALFVNEVAQQADSGNGEMTLRVELLICTPAYIAERDAAELRLWHQIQRLSPSGTNDMTIPQSELRSPQSYDWRPPPGWPKPGELPAAELLIH